MGFIEKSNIRRIETAIDWGIFVIIPKFYRKIQHKKDWNAIKTGPHIDWDSVLSKNPT